MATPHLSIHLANWHTDPTVDVTALLDRAQGAEDAGIDRIAVSDHVVMGERLEAYGSAGTGGVVGGRQPTGPDGAWLEPLTVLTAVAARTSTIRLQTGVLLAALRRPVVLAKTATTLDAISGGRLDLGVGVGWQREEYEAAGLAFEGRGALLDHALGLCQTLWRGETAYADAHLAFTGVHCSPRPVDPDGIPVWVSGRLNTNVLERIVRFGQGWVPWGDEGAPAQLPGAIARVHDALRAAGRTTDGFAVTATVRVERRDDGALDLDATFAPVPALVAAGVTDVRVGVPLPLGRAATADVLRPVVAAFRACVGRDQPSDR